MDALKEKLLTSDFKRVRQNPKFQSADVRTKGGSIFSWILSIPGGRGTSWEGLVYDVEMTFSRRHPFEPPRVDFPRTHRNTSNPGHPLVDGSGRLRMQKLSFDKWLPTIEASTVIGWLYRLFETEPPSVTSGTRCPFTHLSSETVLQVLTFLDAGDLGRLSQTGKHMLFLCFDESTWAKLYYRSCTSMDGLLGEKEGGACPVRVMGVSGKWFWEGSREAFIRSWEMRKACSGRAYSTARTQELHLLWELGGLMTVTAKLLSDVTSRRFNMPIAAAVTDQLWNMEYLLDSLTMKIASLQRMLAWPGVCRGLVGNKEEDGPSPFQEADAPEGLASIGRQAENGGPGGGGGGGGGGSNSSGSVSGSGRRTFKQHSRRSRIRMSTVVGGVREAGGRSAELSDPSPGARSSPGGRRERSLTPEQQDALRLLCGNLAAFLPRKETAAAAIRPVPRGGLGAGGGNSTSNGSSSSGPASASEGTSVLFRTPAERAPHHHHSVVGPSIPFGMNGIELPARDSWRNIRGDGGGLGGGGVNGGAAAVVNGHGDGIGHGHGPDGMAAAAAALVAGIAAPVNMYDDNHLHQHRPLGVSQSDREAGGTTLQNAQPACGMGGLCWPTLYDLTMAKRRQRERLRECFRKFSPGQRLDVRDPSGVWMGAVVLWVPGKDRGPWENGTAEAGEGAGGAGLGGDAAGGGGAGAAGGGGGHHAGGAEGAVPEWRRLLRVALIPDGGHVGMNGVQNAVAGGVAAAWGAFANGIGGGIAGDGNGSPNNLMAAAALEDEENTAALEAIDNSAGDWVSTGSPEAAQSYLTSAVSAAADCRPWPPPESYFLPPSSAVWPASTQAAAAAAAANLQAAHLASTSHPPPPSPAPLASPPVSIMGSVQPQPQPQAHAALHQEYAEHAWLNALDPLNAPPNLQGQNPPAPAAAVAAAAAGAVAMPILGGVPGGGGAGGAGGAGVPVSYALRGGAAGSSVLIHYEGHKSRYDEWIGVHSPRLAPFRSRTCRPLSVTMQSVEKVVNGASVSSPRGVPAPGCVEVSLSCPWVSHCAGGGVVTYRLPRSTSLGAVLADFCHLAGVSLWRATIQRARLRLASDIRHGKCDVEELDCRRTLEYLDVNSGSVLLVCVVPTAKSLVTAPSPCMSHVQLGSEGYRDGQQRDCRPRGGDGKPAEVGGRAS